MTTETVRLEQRDQVTYLSLARPERRNALGQQMLADLEDAVAGLTRQPDVRVIVLRADGPSFCAGADLEERAIPSTTIERRVALARRWQRLFEDIERLPATTIASLHGAAVGGGMVLALTCDLRIAADDLRMWMPEVAMGGSPLGGAVPRLVRELGLPVARDLVLTGRRVDAATALAWGLVTRVVAVDDLDDASAELATQLATAPPGGLRIATRALRASASSAMSLGWADPELAAGRP